MRIVFDTDGESIALPPPVYASMPLGQALLHRHSTREFMPDSFSLYDLSSLLWAACGVNRQESGGCTAPSAHDWQEIDVYAVLEEGAYKYIPRTHHLMQVAATDLRGHTGLQDFVAMAPVNLVYVAHRSRMTDVGAGDWPFLAGVDAGCVAQNVYLHCAAAGLATVVRALIDRARLAQVLGLEAEQRIMLAQTVGRAATGR